MNLDLDLDQNLDYLFQNVFTESKASQKHS